MLVLSMRREPPPCTSGKLTSEQGIGIGRLSSIMGEQTGASGATGLGAIGIG